MIIDYYEYHYKFTNFNYKKQFMPTLIYLDKKLSKGDTLSGLMTDPGTSAFPFKNTIQTL